MRRRWQIMLEQHADGGYIDKWDLLHSYRRHHESTGLADEIGLPNLIYGWMKNQICHQTEIGFECKQ